MQGNVTIDPIPLAVEPELAPQRARKPEWLRVKWTRTRSTGASRG